MNFNFIFEQGNKPKTEKQPLFTVQETLQYGKLFSKLASKNSTIAYQKMVDFMRSSFLRTENLTEILLLGLKNPLEPIGLKQFQCILKLIACKQAGHKLNISLLSDEKIFRTLVKLGEDAVFGLTKEDIAEYQRESMFCNNKEQIIKFTKASPELLNQILQLVGINKREGIFTTEETVLILHLIKKSQLYNLPKILPACLKKHLKQESGSSGAPKEQPGQNAANLLHGPTNPPIQGRQSMPVPVVTNPPVVKPEDAKLSNELSVLGNPPTNSANTSATNINPSQSFSAQNFSNFGFPSTTPSSNPNSNLNFQIFNTPVSQSPPIQKTSSTPGNKFTTPNIPIIPQNPLPPQSIPPFPEHSPANQAIPQSAASTHPIMTNSQPPRNTSYQPQLLANPPQNNPQLQQTSMQLQFSTPLQIPEPQYPQSNTPTNSYSPQQPVNLPNVIQPQYVAPQPNYQPQNLQYNNPSNNLVSQPIQAATPQSQPQPIQQVQPVQLSQPPTQSQTNLYSVAPPQNTTSQNAPNTPPQVAIAQNFNPPQNLGAPQNIAAHQQPVMIQAPQPQIPTGSTLPNSTAATSTPILATFHEQPQPFLNPQQPINIPSNPVPTDTISSPVVSHPVITQQLTQPTRPETSMRDLETLTYEQITPPSARIEELERDKNNLQLEILKIKGESDVVITELKNENAKLREMLSSTTAIARVLIKQRGETNSLLKTISAEQKQHIDTMHTLDKDYQAMLLDSIVERDKLLSQVRTNQQTLASLVRHKAEQLRRFASHTNKELIDLAKTIDEQKLAVAVQFGSQNQQVQVEQLEKPEKQWQTFETQMNPPNSNEWATPPHQ